MSMVLAPPDELLPPAALVLLLLLLQPAAAKAIAAKAAIALVRLIIFLSLIEVVRLPRSALTGLVWASSPCAAGDERIEHILCGGRTDLGVDSGQDPEPGERCREHLGRRFPHPGAESASSPSICRTPA